MVVLGNFFLIRRMCRWGLLFVFVYMREKFVHIVRRNLLLSACLETHSLYRVAFQIDSGLLLSWVVVVLVE